MSIFRFGFRHGARYAFGVFLLQLLFLAGTQAQQSPTSDDRLLARFEAEHLSMLAAEHPQILAYWNYYLDHSYYLADVPPEKGVGMETIDLPDDGVINIFELPVKPAARERVYYKVSGSDQLLILYSEFEMAARFRAATEPKSATE